MHWASQSLSLPTELIKGFDFWDVIGSHFAAKFQSRNEAMMVCGTILRTIWSNITYRGTLNDRKLYTVIFCFYFIIFSSCLFPSYTSSWTLSIYFFFAYVCFFPFHGTLLTNHKLPETDNRTFPFQGNVGVQTLGRWRCKWWWQSLPQVSDTVLLSQGIERYKTDTSRSVCV